MEFPGRIAIIGGGSFATALAKIALESCERIDWYLRKASVIKDFKQLHHNPRYLTSVHFDTNRITFHSDINKAIEAADTLIFATPSPFFKQHMTNVKVSLTDKFIISAIKGIVPDENMLITDYLRLYFNVSDNQMAALGGPCHAEEIALERLTYVTVACTDMRRAEALALLLSNHYVRVTCCQDVLGVEYATVLKNVYAIGAGICHGLKLGDNFQAVYVSNAIREMRSFVHAVLGMKRDIIDSVYLGDLLVTAYSRFSRNRTFGTMIGKGYSVKTAQLEMEMIAEGYYGTKCLHQINEELRVEMPMLDMVYSILYEKADSKERVEKLALTFN